MLVSRGLVKTSWPAETALTHISIDHDFFPSFSPDKFSEYILRAVFGHDNVQFYVNGEQDLIPYNQTIWLGIENTKMNGPEALSWKNLQSIGEKS